MSRNEMPYIKVPCPTCGAAAGERCRPIGYVRPDRRDKQKHADYHLERKAAHLAMLKERK